MKSALTVDDYIRSVPKEFQPALMKLRSTIREAAPESVERMSYGMPFYEYGGAGFHGRLIYFSLAPKHVRIYIPPSLGGQHMLAWEKYRSTKSAFHVPLDEPFPFALVSDTVKALIRQRDKQIRK